MPAKPKVGNKMAICFVFLPVVFYSPAQAESWTWKSLLTAAQSRNPTLEQAREELKRSEYLRRTTYAEFLPTLELNAQQANSENQVSGLSTDENTNSFGADLNLSLFNGLASLSRWKQADASVAQKKASLYESQVNLHYDLRTAYFRCLITLSRQVIAERIATRQQDNAKFIRLKYASGSEPLWSYNMAAADAKDAELTLLGQKNELQKNLLDLWRLLGADTPLQVEFKESAASLIVKPKVNLTTVIENHPEYLSMQAQILVAEQELREIEAEYYPSVSGNLGWSRSETDDNAAVEQTTLGLSASWSLFDGFSTHNRRQASKAKLNALQSKMSDLKRRLKNTIEQKQLDYDLNSQRWPITKQNLAAAQERLQTVTTQYRAGLKKYLDWEQANSKLISAEQEEIAALETVLLSQASLEKALAIRGDGNE